MSGHGAENRHHLASRRRRQWPIPARGHRGGEGERENGGQGEGGVDGHYFGSYAHVGIHQEMIQDHARTDAYEDAIMGNTEFIRGKVVLDVGCGTGILSIFAARAGARKVYAVDASDIAQQAREIVARNGLDATITVIQSKVEDLELEEKADVLVSEWMGYMLLYENMMSSVIAARDKFLKPGGLILPSSATIYVVPFTNEEYYDDTLNFWKDVYGIDMSSMIPLARKSYFEEPAVEYIGAENVLSKAAQLWTMDCNTVTLDDLTEVRGAFACKSMMMARMHGLALWFSVEFPIRGTQDGHPTEERDHKAHQQGDARQGVAPDQQDSTSPQRKKQKQQEERRQLEEAEIPPASAAESEAVSTDTNADAAAATAPATSTGAAPATATAAAPATAAPSGTAAAPAANGSKALEGDARSGGRGPGKRDPEHCSAEHEAEDGGLDRVVLSTAPEDTPTHWMQTLLYLDEPMAVEQDDAIAGDLTIRPSTENSRFLDITFTCRLGDREATKSCVMK